MEKEYSSNYEKQVDIGKEWFLKYNQEKLIKKYNLRNDNEYLYLNYIGTPYRIDRKNGTISCQEKEEWKECREYTIVMTIYDFLCYHQGDVLPAFTGQRQPIGSFAAAGSSPSAEFFAKKYEKAFTGKTEKVKQACRQLGGILQPRLAGADLTFEISIVPWFSVTFQFWDADEEFPAKILLLWDKVSLSYLHFETTYYLQGDLLDAIAAKADLKILS